MDDMTLLREHRADVETDEAALGRVRARVVEHRSPVTRHARLRRVRRPVVMAAGAFALVGLLTVTLTWSGPGPGAIAPAAAALSRAAEATTTLPVPAPGEYLHVRTVTKRWLDGEMDTSVTEQWVPGEPGEDPTVRGIEGLVYRVEATLPSISTDPGVSTAEVVDWLLRDSGDLRGEDAAVSRAGDVFIDGAIPTRFKAEVFAALATIDGIRLVDDDTTFQGRDVTIVGYRDVFDEQFILDNRTGRLVAIRSVGLEGNQQEDGTSSATFSQNVVSRLPARAEVDAVLRGSALVPLDELPR